MIYSPSRIGQLNRRALLRELQKWGVASRADLAKALGMSHPTSGKIVEELLALDVLEEVVSAPATGPQAHRDGREPVVYGRPAQGLQLNQSRPKFLGIQLGVNETRLAALTFNTKAQDTWQAAFKHNPASEKPVRDWEQKLRQAAAALSGKHFIGVLISAPGVVDEPTNRILFSPNLHWTEKVDFGAILRKIWPLPVLLLQEERVLAQGHHWTHPECEDFLLVDFGEGVGGAIIVNGTPLAHQLPINGEIGHTPVLGNQRPCGCGTRGCVETLVSERGLLESFAAAAPRTEPTWKALSDHIDRNGVEPWLAHALDAVAVVIAGALNVLGLRQVVITGNLTELPPGVMQHLTRAIENGAMWARFGTLECHSAPRHRTAGLVAAGIDLLVLPERKDSPAPQSRISRSKKTSTH